ncbi:protein translocase subunit [Dimargaris cristalligena]|uniref:Mitochondrial import inner membrane translocase subunit n=1 Tax=Dimargaris cristalligena TaxID=215637 RepID=A0A4P9ZNQ2_9FUNG|nr:protein translocase subunit [Dimargaris cristalligena]RKP34923.1 Tim10/DDP family zinc finger-domain-containing protein [Dimargaris cristalligena]|eukprot:RKP34923.1 Tim10/DDP family zinc finger-domain-containing protein [Dimargaris cristalligena]
MAFNLTGNKSAELKDKIRQELALANAREIIQHTNETCFKSCVPNPGQSLSGSETNCLSSCVKKYLEAWNHISQAYVQRVQKEEGNGRH